MTSPKQKNSADPPTDDPIEEPVAVGLKQVIDAVVELNIARKNMLIYPSEHAQVEQSASKAYQTIVDVLEKIQSITLGVTGNSLMVEIEQPGRMPAILPVDPSHAVCRSFSGMLKEYRIATVKLYGDMDQEELIRFLTLLIQPVDVIESRGGIEQAADEAGLDNIEITAVDYSRFKYSDEKEISRHDKTESAGEKNLWETFISHLIAQTLSEDEIGVEADLLKTADPDQLAGFLNEGRIDTDVAVDAYRKAVDEFFFQGREAGAGETPDGDSSSLQNWNDLLQRLESGKKGRFLSVPFLHISRQASSGKSRRFLSAMPGGLVIDMLGEAARGPAEEAVPVRALVEKLMGDGDLWADARDDLEKVLRETEAVSDPSTRGAVSRRPAMSDDIRSREDGAPSEEQETQEPFSLEEYLTDVDGPRVDMKIARLLMAFMNGDINGEEYRIFAERLVEISGELLNIPDFALLASVLRVFDKHRKKKSDAAIRAVAAESARQIREPQFISKAVSAFLTVIKKQTDDVKDAVDFLAGLGPDMIIDLVRLYAEDEKASLSRPLVELVSHYKKKAVAEISSRLDDPRPSYLINLIVLLRAMNIREIGPELRLLLRYESREVQTAALETLLQFEDRWGVAFLKKMMQENRIDTVAEAISLAGRYRVGELVPELLSRLKRFPLFAADLEKNRIIINALGQIGDPAAVPSLTRLAGTFWPFAPARAKKKMMQALFESLPGYPGGDFSRLAVLGRRMGDSRIDTICRSLDANPVSRRDTNG